MPESKAKQSIASRRVDAPAVWCERVVMLSHSLITRVVERFSTLPAVQAVALAGSQVTGQAGKASDYDVYVYSLGELSASVRRAVGVSFTPNAQLVDFWGPGLEWDDPATGAHVDTIFFTAGWVENQIERVMVRCEPSLGYSTAFLHTVRTSEILFDRTGWFAALQERARLSYPDALVQHIIAHNFPVLRDSYSSYRQQLEKAVLRNDQVSLNHRTAALLASVFDIVFALNRVAHPGEKRLLDWVERLCPVRPPTFRADVIALLDATGTDTQAVLPAVDQLVDGIEALLRREGYV